MISYCFAGLGMLLGLAGAIALGLGLGDVATRWLGPAEGLLWYGIAFSAGLLAVTSVLL